MDESKHCGEGISAGKAPHVLVVNAGPRKRMNTMALLDEAVEGAREACAEVEVVHLYDLAFRGCTSCLACKRKGTKFVGRCAMRDDLTPVLEKAWSADAIVMGTPVYYGGATGEFRSFLERLLFPVDTYLVDDAGARVKILDREIPCGLIYTMNCPEWLAGEVDYPVLLGINGSEVGRLFGSCETLFAYDTYQFNDYAKYDCNMFDAAAKARQRDEQFPRDRGAARDLGRRLVERAEGGACAYSA